MNLHESGPAVSCDFFAIIYRGLVGFTWYINIVSWQVYLINNYYYHVLIISKIGLK